MARSQISALNDNFRRTFVGSRVVLTAGVNELSVKTKEHFILAVQSFDDFTPENDPHGDHDFGMIEIDEDRYFWKVDYYNRELDGGSENPADPEQTTRVLTIMRAEEY